MRPRAKEVIPAHFARGNFLHQWMKKMYNKDGTLKYKSADSYANSVKGPWKQIIEQGEIQGQKINWRDESQPYVIRDQIMKTLRKVYELYSNQLPPLIIEERFKSEFEFGNEIFNLTGQVDEIRVDNGFAIRDHKTKERAPRKEVLDYDLQFTFYPLIIASLIKSNSFDSLSSKIPKILKGNLKSALEKTKNMNVIEIASDISLEYHLMSKGEIVNVSKRTPEHFYELFDTISYAKELNEKYRRENKWPVNRFSCNECTYIERCYEDSQNNKLEEITKQSEIFSKPCMPVKIINKNKTERIKFPKAKKKKLEQSVLNLD